MVGARAGDEHQIRLSDDLRCASIVGALIAGVMGMNVNFSAEVFAGSVLFWGAIALIVLLAAGTLGAARMKHWI